LTVSAENPAGGFDLTRFLEAQEPVYAQVVAELRRGRKESHWMWFIFPQIAGLGQSAAARRYAVGSAAEAAAYLAHPVLGRRLLECTRLVLEAPASSAEEIFGYPDVLKFRSCMTLFAHAAAENEPFLQALKKYYGGEGDPLTLAQL
jgi:uncharacterized protein (DUF1810 family)